MLSGNAQKTVKACRFCWMCRHLCPIGLATGKESNTPRAKALLLELNEKGIDLSAEMAQDMYECCLCNACASDCETGYEPPVYIREARTHAAVNNLLPPHVQPVVDSMLQQGNLYGESAESKFDMLRNDIADLPKQAEVLLYVGDVAARKTPDIVRALIRILKKAKVNFTIHAQEEPSGALLFDLIGTVGEVQQQAKACAEQINASGAKMLVVLDPACARAFTQEYENWGCTLTPQVFTATAFVAELVESGALKVERKAPDTVTFHDPCRLSRDLDETQPARKIISAMGLQLNEMFLHGKQTKCCGGEIVGAHSPHLTKQTAAGRLADAARTGTKTVICACPACEMVLSGNNPTALAVTDLFVLLDQYC